MEEDNKTTLQLTLEFLKNTWFKIQAWLRPVSTDTLFQKIMKSFGKVLALLLAILFSPVIIFTLVIAFLIAF